MAGYRSYFFKIDNRISERFDFLAETDELAIIEARATYAESLHGSGFELWQQARLVHAQGRASE